MTGRCDHGAVRRSGRAITQRVFVHRPSAGPWPAQVVALRVRWRCPSASDGLMSPDPALARPSSHRDGRLGPSAGLTSAHPPQAFLPQTQMPTVVLARDLPRGVLDAEVRSGHLVRVRRGASTPRAELPQGDDPAARHHLALARIAAVAAQLGPAPVVSHQSAALVWGLPVWKLPATVHLLHSVRRSGRSATDITWHHVSRGEHPSVTCSGLRVTSLEETVVACLTTAAPLDAVVVADAALARGVDRNEVERLLTTRASRRGVARGREVLHLATTGSQSPWESACRVVLQAVGLPAPETQIRVDTDLGRFYADMGWREWRLLVEFDGAVKYSGTGRAATAALVAEKRRQHAVEDVGWRMLRTTAADLGPTLPLVRRLRKVLPETAFRTTRPRPHLLADL